MRKVANVVLVANIRIKGGTAKLGFGKICNTFYFLKKRSDISKQLYGLVLFCVIFTKILGD